MIINPPLNDEDKRILKIFGVCVVVFVVAAIIVIVVEVKKEEPFGNTPVSTNVYRYWNKKLKEFEEAPFNLGKPGGILRYNPDLRECNVSDQNLVPQSKMTFRPTYRLNGCTVMDLQYPE